MVQCVLLSSSKGKFFLKGKSTKKFDSHTEQKWEGLETLWFNKKVGKWTEFHLTFWKNVARLYHFLIKWDLVLTGNSNVVEITKESCNYSKNLSLPEKWLFLVDF